MYSFQPDEEQQMLIDVTRRLAANDLRPAAHEAEEHGEIPVSLVAKGWELGVLQASIPAEFGGFGERSALTSVLALEELAYGDLAGALAMMVPGLFAIPVLTAGTEEQKSTYLPAIAEGAWTPWSAALIEYQFDFDPQDLHTIARPDGGDYLISGEKRLVPFATEAKTMLVYANLDGQTQAFIVDAKADGVTVGEREQLMGINALPLYSIHLDSVRIPKANRLGGEAGHDFGALLSAMRIGISAAAIGVARASFEYARDYAKEREVLGSMIAQKQSIAFMLAEMATEIEATRLMIWEAAWLLDQDNPDAERAAYLAYSGAVDMAMMVTDRGVQILGGHGYIREHPVELWMRNGRGIASLTGLAIV
ncbi:MAG: acyl-CoA dehydrogenase family protein [Chloroflexi bacterium]|nr:acyl-CoA dehydrogenase family protein [Chloroflexota bacterium]